MALQIHLMGIRCPQCGREYGSLRRKTITQSQERLTNKNMPLCRIKKKDYGVEQMLSVNRNLHALKYDTLFGINDRKRKPIINPVEHKLSKPSPTLVRKMERLVKGFLILRPIFPFILQKYPELLDTFEDFRAGMESFLEYVKPITDARWDRSWAEWGELVKYTRDHGYSAASRRYYAVKDGNKKYLSPHYIKRKIKDLEEFNKKSKSSVPPFIDYMKKLFEIVRRDVNIRKKYIELVKEYDENKIQIISQELNKSRAGKTYSYTYYFISHYDPKKYQQKKSDLKKGKIKRSSVTGKIECGPFEEKVLPPAAIERLGLQNNKDIQMYSKILFILSFRPFTDLSITAIIASETKDTIKSMLEELRIMGLVERMNYSDNKSGISDGLNKKCVDLDDYDKYTMLNASNRDSQLILEDYKRNCPRNEMLKITKKISEYSRKEKPPQSN